MPKRPFVIAPPSRRKKGQKAPETADEYLAAAVDLEESGERWRSGDVAKAGRFFVQAIDAYEVTLLRYPDNFDARYNRARLLYTLTQLPLPPDFFPSQSTPSKRLLAAVEAHRECNDLEKDSSDILFNYGQTLSSLGEFFASNSTDEESPQQEHERLLKAKEAFETAWGVLHQCLGVQEREYKATQEQNMSFSGLSSPGVPDEDAMGDEGGIKLSEADMNGFQRRGSTTSTHSSSSSTNAQWAAIVEPTTKSTLLDTALAMLEVQTSILGLGTAATAKKLFTPEYLGELTGHAAKVVENYILPIAGTLHQDSVIEADELVEREAEAILARANFLTALAEVKFYLGVINGEDWEREIKGAFETYAYTDASTTRTIDLSTSWKAFCDRSTAYTPLFTTISASASSQSWKLASLANQDLAAAVKVAPEKGKPEVYLARGNLELLRSRIPIEAAAKARAVLRKNAGVYFRGSVAASGSSLIGAVDGGRVKEVVEEAKVKEMVARLEDGDPEGVKELVRGGMGRQVIWKVMKGAVEEGVFGRDVVEMLDGLLRW
ncbi:hypothetical protein ABW19_dt0202468 [Dactylella cylindrospora]|nr:hypothetical protein ABW19_dt0202468 [Dactylella cylindrospora]